MVAYIIIAYTHIKVASTSRPSSPSSHKRMDHDPLSKFSALWKVLSMGGNGTFPL
jgi:hypothetical protein